MLAFVEAFYSKCMQIQEAIEAGDDELVSALDRELEPLVAAILAFRADSIPEIYIQLQFMSYLIRHQAADSTCVLRHSTALSFLLDRYFGAPRDSDAEFQAFLPQFAPSAARLFSNNDNAFNGVILDSLPDRVAVITKDYRYLYSNPANALYLNSKPVELIGRHLVEFIGEARFEQQVRARLDACFAGEIVDYSYEVELSDGGMKTVRCRMTPFRAAPDEIVGALIVLQDIGVRLEVLAA
ncbi:MULTISPECIES: PAS domain-containing protein [unclassified Sinorhizobium]|uniref:PAS domain-containing protein n=1 Tax=unclassified Sinorhizobium TaxID=2613772 RepID=UPI003523FAA4